MRLNHARRTAGIALMGGSLLLGALTPLAASAAEGEVPEGLETVEVEQRAFWNADNSKYADNVATSQFPPQAVCLVQPAACFFPEGEQDPSGDLGIGKTLNETTATVNAREQELLTTIAENDTGPPEDPVPPENSPVSIAFGKENYRSAIEFALPELPAGEELDTFHLVLQQGDPTYANESPAFRRAVLAALTCASENEESPFGRCAPEEFQKIPTEDLSDGSPLTVEACPITGDWKAGRAQDEDTIPEVDCLFTAVGVPVEADGSVAWVFDLTFAAKAWYGGMLEQNGILLRPGAAENFAYGDPETTYSKQVTFLPEVQVAATSSEPFVFDGGGTTTTTDTSTSTDDSTPTSTSTATPPPTSTPSTTGSVQVPSTSTPPSQSSVQSPSVANPEPQAPQTASPAQETVPTLAAGTPLGQPETPGWTWPALLLAFLAGAWLLARSLQETAVVAAERSGAMTRLLERRAAASGPDLITG